MECILCPRNCKTDRQNALGFCQSPDTAVITRAAPHFWEEPCISGEKGSGTVFFAGCNLRCNFCQNHEISRNTATGKQVTPQQLLQLFHRLKQ
jgi:putative pyruvate formate lyase activating enzyme